MSTAATTGPTAPTRWVEKVGRSIKGSDTPQSFENVKQLTTAIRAFINAYNQRCRPFVWTKPADQILERATRKPTSETRH